MGRRRRKHSDEFKAQVVAACSQSGVSIAAVSMAHGVNPNLARRWIMDAAPEGGRELRDPQRVVLGSVAPNLALPPPFVPVALPSSPPPMEIRIELRRGATTVSVNWPMAAASDCAAWVRELLR